MNTQWLAMEHYRMHVIEQWPEGPRKDAALAAVWSTIRSLSARSVETDQRTVCSICGGRPQTGEVVEFRSRRVRLADRAA